MTDPAGSRVTVAHPSTLAARAEPGPRTGRTLLGSPDVSELVLRTLMRVQLRLALRSVGILVGLAGGLPLLFALWPSTGDVRIVGIPLAFVLLGGLAYPLLAWLGVTHVRAAERVERDYLAFARER